MIFRNKIEIKILIDLLLTDPSFVSRLLSRKEKKEKKQRCPRATTRLFIEKMYEGCGWASREGEGGGRVTLSHGKVGSRGRRRPVGGVGGIGGASPRHIPWSGVIYCNEDLWRQI